MRTFSLMILSTLALGVGLSSCAPRAQSATDPAAAVQVSPALIKLSAPAARGQNVTVQGRYLGGPGNGRVILGADLNGDGGYTVPAAAIVSWTDSMIVFTVPSNAPVGGSFLLIQVGALRSNALPYSVSEAVPAN